MWSADHEKGRRGKQCTGSVGRPVLQGAGDAPMSMVIKIFTNIIQDIEYLIIHIFHEHLFIFHVIVMPARHFPSQEKVSFFYFVFLKINLNELLNWYSQQPLDAASPLKPNVLRGMNFSKIFSFHLM